ncbi:MAG: SIS domain-containing protein [Nitrospinota bacterium]
MAVRETGARGGVGLSFLEDLARARRAVVVTGKDGAQMGLQAGLAGVLDLVEEAGRSGGKLMFIGNGGSAAIASHLAVDYWKNGGLPALAFNDAALLTCISNDFGYERVFAEPIQRFGRPGDLLVAVSSSGRSPNILRGVEVGRKVGCQVVTLSGFDDSNALRRTGDLNFYVPSHSYGIVEITHLSLLHAILEEGILAREDRGRGIDD